MKNIMRFLKGFSVFFIIAALIFIISNCHLTVRRYRVSSQKLPEAFKGYKIALLSDLHNNSFGKDNEHLLNRLEKENPDIVLLAGDMISTDDTDYSVFFSLAEKITKKYNTFYIVGNHEQALEINGREQICRSVESLGATTVNNEKITLKRGNSQINLYGMWFNLRYYTDRSNNATEEEQGYYFTAETMKEVLGPADKEQYNILLTHNPLYFETYKEWGADLTLSGHTHGGMIRIPFYKGIYSPEKTFFPKYDGGLFEEDGKYLAVSRGLGNGGIGFRLFNCPELVFVTLE